MHYNEEGIHWDTEDTGTSSSQWGSNPYPGVNGDDVDIQYCYYYL